MPINVALDEKNLSIQGVKFRNKQDYVAMKNAIGSAMYEGFEPTKVMVELLRDIHDGKKGTEAISSFVLG